MTPSTTVVGGLIVFAAIITAALIRQPRAVAEDQVTHRPIQLEEDGYVSSQTCKTCHPSQYESWHSSYHRTMTQVATPQSARSDFEQVVVTDTGGGPMMLERRGQELWAEFDDPDSDGTGSRAGRITRRVVMITGSHHQQVYWYHTGNSRVLGQLPAMYLIAERRWIPRTAAFLAPPLLTRSGSESGRWNSACINCHATHGKRQIDPLFGSQAILKADTTAAEFGIACEACHGPGEEHANLNRSPWRRYWLHLTGGTDQSTVHPKRLNPRLSSQVCGRCHSISYYYTQAEELRANTEGVRYRPGHDLTDSLFVAQPARDLDSPIMKRLVATDPDLVRGSFWSDGMVRVSGREYNGLLDSPCFKDASAETRMMSCSSCHTMHKTGDDQRSLDEWARTHQVSAGMDSNKACSQCHDSVARDVSSHTRHAPTSSGTLCYNCHMPFTTYGLLRAMRSHQISSPSVAASIETGRPNACNLCHLDKTLEWTSDYLAQWYGTPKTALGEDERAVAGSVLWALRGDAGQRALVTWSMGWQPAQEVSGVNWMVPYLLEGLRDPYAAVRSISYRSLRSLPGLADFEYDFAAPPDGRSADGARALALWQAARGRRDRPTERALLFNQDGSMRIDDVGRLLRQRDNRPLLLRE